jgi:hypothetical protein
MGARSGERTDAKIKVHVIGEQGSVAQMLHPLWIARNDISHMSNALRLVDGQLSLLTSGVKLVVSGGGFIEISHTNTYSPKTWKSEKTIDELTTVVRAKMQLVATALKDSERDYVIGVDVFDMQGTGGGQFAVFIRAGEISTIAWKSYPVDEESKWLAGFGTDKGRNSPRIVSSALGKAMLLVCHDSQAYNHRNSANVSRAYSPTHRQHVINGMVRMMKAEKPEWIFSLIHQIDKEGSIRTFRNSYSQIHQDYRVPAVVGAFGYSPNVQTILERLAHRAQFPDGKAGVVAILEVN